MLFRSFAFSKETADILAAGKSGTSQIPIKGIPYNVINVTSTFKGGKFEQTLDLVGADLPPPAGESGNSTEDSRPVEGVTGGSVTGTAPDQVTNGSTTSGFVNEAPAPTDKVTPAAAPNSSSSNTVPPKTANSNSGNQSTSPTGGLQKASWVADDDAASSNKAIKKPSNAEQGREPNNGLGSGFVPGAGGTVGPGQGGLMKTGYGGLGSGEVPPANPLGTGLGPI